jgi:ketosteroid isomerase-like protein
VKGPPERHKLAIVPPVAIAMLAWQGRVDHADEESSIRKLESDWSQAAQSKDVAKFVSFYSHAMRKLFGSVMSTPRFALTFRSDKVVVGKAADLAHTQGRYHLTIDDAQGGPVTDTGKFVVVWRKQPDGSWRVLADIFNSDIPAAPRGQ